LSNLITVSFFAIDNSENGKKDVPVIRLAKKKSVSAFEPLGLSGVSTGLMFDLLLFPMRHPKIRSFMINLVCD